MHKFLLHYYYCSLTETGSNPCLMLLVVRTTEKKWKQTDIGPSSLTRPYKYNDDKSLLRTRNVTYFPAIMVRLDGLCTHTREHYKVENI